MTCYSPNHAFEGKVLSANGLRPTVWRERDSFEGRRRELPCGKCVGCKLDYSSSWAVRCSHEAQMHVDNSFVTLTFKDEFLPANRSLDVRHVQLFMKRLRKSIPHKVRYFFCGEYGGERGRPHYHGLLFGHDFSDREFLKVSPSGEKLYRSASLERLWPFGFSSVGDFSFSSAAYVARYTMKKASVKDVDHYVDKCTGEVLAPEFVVMSRRPGIGSVWFDKFGRDVYPHDNVIVNGHRKRPPRFYDGLLAKGDPDLLESLKAERVRRSKKDSDVRLLVREKVKLAQIKSLKRREV